MCYSPIVQSGGKFTLKFSTVRYEILLLVYVYLKKVHYCCSFCKKNTVDDYHKCQNKVVNVKMKNVKQQQCHYFLPTVILMR